MEYQPFGALLPGRNYSSGSYRLGFNSQEQDNEIYNAPGTSYTAEFWQYDSRIARRWNIDPVNPAWNSGYAVFYNNPVLYVDHNGLSPKSRAEKYAKKHGIENFSLTEEQGRARLEWGSVENGVFSANAKKFGLNPIEWAASWFPNVRGGNTGGVGDNGAEEHWSRFADWKVDLSWLNGFFELFSSTTHTGTRTAPGDNGALLERKRETTDNTGLTYETKSGLGGRAGPPGESSVLKDQEAVNQPVFEKIDTFYVTGNADGTYRTHKMPSGEYFKQGDTISISIQSVDANGERYYRDKDYRKE